MRSVCGPYHFELFFVLVNVENAQSVHPSSAVWVHPGTGRFRLRRKPAALVWTS